MSSPVLEALAAAKWQELNAKIAAMAAVVKQIIGPVPYDDGPPSELFRSWCEKKGVASLPASTPAVALFVLEHQGLGIEAVLQHLQGISASHTNDGLADPTTSWWVTAAFNTITKLEAPRSWPKAEKVRFLSLPCDLQRFVVRREQERDKALLKAQNQAALERKQNAKETDESPIQQNAVA